MRRCYGSKSARVFAAVLAAMFLCSCYGAVEAPQGAAAITAQSAADTALPRQLVMAAGKDAPEYILAAAGNFCQKAGSVSGGMFTLDFVAAEDPLALFNAGRADIILLDGEAAENLHPFFAIAGEPFRYGSYEVFSISLNSAQVLRRLSETSGARVAAAYYTGSDVFLGSASLDDALGLNRGAETEIDRDFMVFARPGTRAWIEPNFYGVTVTELEAPALPAAALAEPGALTELPLEIALEAGAALAGNDGGAESLAVTRAFHRAAPVWLIYAPSLYEDLPPLGQAALDEAAAFMAGDIDGVCLAREEEILDELRSGGAEIYGGFTAGRSRIFRAEAALMADMPAPEREFRELLNRLR